MKKDLYSHVILTMAGIILLLSVVFLSMFTSNSCRYDTTDYFENKIRHEVSAFELKGMINNNEDFQLFDARSNYVYNQSHIRGAANVDIEKLEEDINPFDKNELTIVYCYTEDCLLASRTIIELAKLGFNNLKELSTGFEGFAENYPDYIEGLSIPEGTDAREILNITETACDPNGC